MKFYRYVNSFNYWDRIKINNLTAIYKERECIAFYKNGSPHNIKNATYINDNKNKSFYLNNKCYGNQDNFTKHLWRKFVKMQVFK